MKKIILISIFSLLVFSCTKTRDVIIERYDNGQKKIVVTYQGTGSNELIYERKIYRE